MDLHKVLHAFYKENICKIDPYQFIFMAGEEISKRWLSRNGSGRIESFCYFLGGLQQALHRDWF